MAVHRTYMFAPGNHPRRVEKVFTLACDAVILDLEDAVAIAEKEATRTVVVEALMANPGKPGYVRVNAWDTDFCFRDVEAVMGPWLTGIVLPKVEDPAQIAGIDWLMSNLERERGMPAGSVDLLPIIETGKGVANVRAIAGRGAATRVRLLSFGAGDYTKDMAMRWTLGETECDHARAEVVLASRAEGLEAPLDTVWIHIKDLDGLKRSAEHVRDMGFQGKLCIHPDQIGPVNAVFTPTAEQVDFAKKVVAAFQKAEAEGLASIQLDGYFIDYPIVDQARRTLDRWNSIQEG
ncbi:MAG: CoA ester lyase [Rhodospirillaceae bacterium]